LENPHGVAIATRWRLSNESNYRFDFLSQTQAGVATVSADYKIETVDVSKTNSKEIKMHRTGIFVMVIDRRF